MTDTLYGADLGSVATDVVGNVESGQSFLVYTDTQGANLFTLTKTVADNFTVGEGTGGAVEADSIGRILFYAQDTDATLWLKNGPRFWAINPVKMSDVIAARIASALTGNTTATNGLNARLTTAETSLAALTSAGARSWQMWRGRMSATRTTTSANYTSLNFSSTITAPASFAANLSNDAVSVSVAGWYRVSLRVGFAANAVGVRSAMIILNVGATTMDTATAPPFVTAEDDRAPATGSVSTVAIAEDFFLSPTDSVLFVARQTSGGALVVDNGRHWTSASLEYLGAA